MNVVGHGLACALVLIFPYVKTSGRVCRGADRVALIARRAVAPRVAEADGPGAARLLAS